MVSEGLDGKAYKLIIRFDRGSPNMARGTRKLIKEPELPMSPDRAFRPTEKVRQARWYRARASSKCHLPKKWDQMESIPITGKCRRLKRTHFLG